MIKTNNLFILFSSKSIFEILIVSYYANIFQGWMRLLLSV